MPMGISGEILVYFRSFSQELQRMCSRNITAGKDISEDGLFSAIARGVYPYFSG